MRLPLGLWLVTSLTFVGCGEASHAPDGAGAAGAAGSPSSAGQNSGGGSGNQAGRASGGASVGDSAGSSPGGAGGSGSGTGGAMLGGSGGMRAEPTCSDSTLRTGPPAGKENLKTDPIDDQFPFSTHWMGRFSDNPAAVGITGLADFDHDGDLDFASGQRGGQMQWWEYCSPDHWAQHVVGSGHSSPGGGNAVDADGDGWVDLVAGDSWYRNPQNPREDESWDRHGIGVAGAEDVAVGDIDGDGKQDVVWVWGEIDPQWRRPGMDPSQPWPMGATFEHRQQQGGFIADIDGDHDHDVLVGKQYWYRNVDGGGKQWETVNFPNQFDDSPLVTVGDIDGDGDMDFAMCTHFGARVAWFENTDGEGTQMSMHLLASNKNKLHAVFALDFDNDGDLDIYSGESTGTAWIWDNTDGKGTFIERAISKTARGHDARVGDVDCDGDLDIVGKPWGEGEAEPRDHIYLKNEHVERGGKPLFARPAGEVWHATEQRLFCP
jgi:hypothetical protein